MGVGRQVGGGGGSEPDNRGSAEEKGKREGAFPLRSTTTHSSLSAHCPEALSNGYRGVQLLCFVVCLYQGQGGDDLSLFVGISGSVMWL